MTPLFRRTVLMRSFKLGGRSQNWSLKDERLLSFVISCKERLRRDLMGYWWLAVMFAVLLTGKLLRHIASSSSIGRWKTFHKQWKQHGLYF